MAYIDPYLQDILSAVYGEEVRGSIHDAIEAINDEASVILSIGTAVSSATSSSTGFFEGSLYINSSTYELWKCVGTDSWSSQGVLKGSDGSPGTPGQDGNKWYVGLGISGKSPYSTVYPSSGVTAAIVGDCYLNKSEGAVYHCTAGGAASVATWVYDFTLTGGGGASYTAGNGIDSSKLTNDDIIQLDFGSISGTETTKAVTGAAINSALSGKADTSAIKNGTLTIQQNGTNLQTFTANQDTNATANIKTDEWHGTTGTVSSGSVTFSGIDDSAGTNGYELFVSVTSSSTNKNPSSEISSISGEGTSSMSITFTTDADNGASCKLRIVK